MPLYEYRCESCGEITEVLQKFSDPAPETCEHCSGKLRKLISLSSFQLKGSGWYVTDYANRHSRSESKPPAGRESGGDSAASTSTDAKKKESSGTSNKD